MKLPRKWAPRFPLCPQQDLTAMQHYGMNLGIAYQLIDDALRLQRHQLKQMGKNIGNDLAEGKPTLPLIHAYVKAHKLKLRSLRKAIETGSCEQLDAIL